MDPVGRALRKSRGWRLAIFSGRALRFKRNASRSARVSHSAAIPHAKTVGCVRVLRGNYIRARSRRTANALKDASLRSACRVEEINFPHSLRCVRIAAFLTQERKDAFGCGAEMIECPCSLRCAWAVNPSRKDGGMRSGAERKLYTSAFSPHCERAVNPSREERKDAWRF
jgi:hypothetical protein